MDESDILTVLNKLLEVIAEKGKRLVGKIVSAYRRQLVTVVCCLSTSGIYVPPAMIFARKRMCNELYSEAPIGTLPLISDTRYMNTDLFVQ
jgi:adenine/guanine phosphoribosyltransferase-like PRPP-binding protein